MDYRDFASAVETVREAGVTLGDWLQVDAETIGRWERGDVRVPRLRARQITWLLKQSENDSRIRGADLPECTWLSEHNSRANTIREDPEGRTDALVNLVNETTAHIKACEVCAANDRWCREHLLELGTFPAPGIGGAILGALGRLPGSLVPAAIGATLLGGLVAIRLVFAVMFLMVRSSGFSDLLSILGSGALAVAAAAAGGAAGGLVIPLVRPFLRPLGAAGDYLTGIFVVAGYAVALALLAPVAFGEPLVESNGGLMLLIGYAAAMGLIGAYFYRRQARTEDRRA